jgi:hypothetical protein
MSPLVGVIFVFTWSAVCFGLSMFFSLERPQTPLPAYSMFLNVGVSGLFAGFALILQSWKLMKLEKLVAELRK